MVSRSNILWIIVARLTLGTLLVGIDVVVETGTRHLLGSSPTVLALAALYLLSALYLLLVITSRNHPLQLRIQIFGDLLMATLLVFLSGEVASPYTSLYLVVIAYAAILSGRKDGYAATAGSTILYVGMIDLAYFDLIPFETLGQSFETLNFRIAIVVLGFVSVNFLSSSLSERLQRVRLELEEKSGSLADLQVLNENVIESLRSGLITTDLDGNVLTANRAAETLLEIPSSNLIGHPLSRLFPEDFMSGALAGGDVLRRESLRQEFGYSTPHGQKRYIGAGISPLFNQKNEMIGLIVSFQDLTEVKRLQEEIAIQEKMAVVGHLAAGIAHEIRNPLASMHGSIQMLRKDLQPQGENAHLMDIVLRESDRLNQIIEDFLRYARPRKPEMRPVNLAEIADETISLLRNSPLVRPVHEIVLECAELPPVIQGDADMMRQVFWNLATNCFKAMPQGGRLTIDFKGGSENRVRLRFSDTGIGMDAQVKSTLFQPFTSGFEQGLGIGLAIVYQIIHQHGGQIRVESEKNCGTTVELNFVRA